MSVPELAALEESQVEDRSLAGVGEHVLEWVRSKLSAVERGDTLPA